MVWRRSARFLRAGALCLPLLDAAPVAAAVYCCDDSNGRPICGDVLPAACYGRAYRELGAQGTVLRSIAAPLSADEIARRKVEAQRRKDEEARAIKQRRLDQALLSGYGSVEDIDNRREREIAEVERSIEATRARAVESRARREKLVQEAEFYQRRTLPREIVNGLASVDAELAAYATIIGSKIREIEDIRARFNADRARYLELEAAGATRR